MFFSAFFPTNVFVIWWFCTNFAHDNENISFIMNRKKNNSVVCQTLTRAEMEVMNHLWDMEESAGTVRDVLSRYPDPQPAYTTTATFLKILTQKGFVKSEKREGDGKTFYFRPLISRDEYRRRVLNDVKDSFFGGSASSLVSFFAKEERINESDLKELLALVNGK